MAVPDRVAQTETLVTISMRFPNLDRQALAEHIGAAVVAAIAAGGLSTSVSVQSFDPEDDDGAGEE